jgi:hypothetical protein
MVSRSQELDALGVAASVRGPTQKIALRVDTGRCKSG